MTSQDGEAVNGDKLKNSGPQKIEGKKSNGKLSNTKVASTIGARKSKDGKNVEAVGVSSRTKQPAVSRSFNERETQSKVILIVVVICHFFSFSVLLHSNVMVLSHSCHCLFGLIFIFCCFSASDSMVENLMQHPQKALRRSI